MSATKYPGDSRIFDQSSLLATCRSDGACQRRTRSGAPKRLWNTSRDKLARSAGLASPSPRSASLRISSRSYRFVADKYTVNERQAGIELALSGPSCGAVHGRKRTCAPSQLAMAFVCSRFGQKTHVRKWRAPTRRLRLNMPVTFNARSRADETSCSRDIQQAC